jgi:type IX secretion system PorP/SprF family membrane protein
MGIGVVGCYDRVGVTTQTDFYLNYSYHLKLGEGKLSFGLKGGISNYKAQLTGLLFWDKNDQVFASDLTGKIVPKFGFGAYYYHKKFYAGVSVPTTLAFDPGNNFSFDVSKSSELRRHYYVTGGYIFNLNADWKFKPSTLIKVLPSAPVQMDLNLAVLYKDMFWLGASFRTGDAVSFIAEYQANFRFRIGYAYDATFSNLKNYSAGSHEVMIGYDFGKDLIKIKTPRYF